MTSTQGTCDVKGGTRQLATLLSLHVAPQSRYVEPRKTNVRWAVSVVVNHNLNRISLSKVSGKVSCSILFLHLISWSCIGRSLLFLSTMRRWHDRIVQRDRTADVFQTHSPSSLGLTKDTCIDSALKIISLIWRSCEIDEGALQLGFRAGAAFVATVMLFMNLCHQTTPAEVEIAERKVLQGMALLE